MSADSVSEGPLFQLPGEQLTINQLPAHFAPRYGKIPETIYVRECYRELYKTASDSMLAECSGNSATLFTGVPGIGKSLFLVYFIYRFLHDDRFPNKTFAVEFTKGKYVCFQPTANAEEFSCTHQNSSYVYSKDNLLLCDIAEALEPEMRAKWTFIFSSPSPSRYKEILKNAPRARYILPTWSEQEFVFLNANISVWYENFVRYGGVPRSVFSDSNLLKEALDTKGGDIAECFFNYSFGIVNSLQDYMLVHINPPMSEDKKYVYNGITTYSFASDFVFEKLVESNFEVMLAGAVKWFNAGGAKETLDAFSAGVLFEKICLWLKTLNAQDITAVPLSTGDNVTFSVPSEKYILPHDWRLTAQLPVNKLILPRTANLESGDAFFVVANGPCYMLVVFQITVGESHPVKNNGLQKIVQAFPKDVREKITDKFLVFVIPAYGVLDKVQKIVTQKGENIILPDISNRFQQYVYKHTI